MRPAIRHYLCAFDAYNNCHALISQHSRDSAVDDEFVHHLPCKRCVRGVEPIVALASEQRTLQNNAGHVACRSKCLSVRCT